MTKTELLSPAGDFETARAAFAAGADAVYCGLHDFSARAFAPNFSFDDLESLLRLSRAHGKKVYVTLNTLLLESEIPAALDVLSRLDVLRPDALIVQDLGLARLVRERFPSLALHASTQLFAHNLEGVLALGDLGFSRIVLARELSLAEISSIASRCGSLEVECFIHGALCYSLSGLCLFGALEKGRSGNRGQCPYCCRLPVARASGGKSFPFSMKDLRLGEDVRKLAAAGVASLKIEGRMKSPLYVASVTRYYREILDGTPQDVTVEDLETVFSRRTTRLSFDRAKASAEDTEPVIDASSLGHLGALIGEVKKVTRDREGRLFLRFHTSRALEKHDGLQFGVLTKENRPLGMGIQEMRTALSRTPVFRVPAHSDVEVRIDDDIAHEMTPGLKVYCSMSNALKSRFPVPPFRKSVTAGVVPLRVRLLVSADGVEAHGTLPSLAVEAKAAVPSALAPAREASRGNEAARQAFGKLGETSYFLDALAVENPSALFLPSSVLNDLRRQLLAALQTALERHQSEAVAEREIDAAFADFVRTGEKRACRRVKIRSDQSVPDGDWDEVIVALARKDREIPFPTTVRLALPVYTSEMDFAALRRQVKRFLARGYAKWEAADLATLRLLTSLGVRDVSADWTLYAMNEPALETLFALGVRRVVASPESSRETLETLAAYSPFVEFLSHQSTPLFLSLHAPDGSARESGLRLFRRDGLFVTTSRTPRSFPVPGGCSSRLDLSWEDA